MGWGPVDWVERVLPEAKLKNTTTLLFEIFRFERPIPRYLLKTVLPCKALGFSYGLITAVRKIASDRVKGRIFIQEYLSRELSCRMELNRSNGRRKICAQKKVSSFSKDEDPPLSNMNI